MAKKKHFVVTLLIATQLLLAYSIASEPDFTQESSLAAGNTESSMAAKGDKENESTGEGLRNQIEENVSKSSAEQPKNNTSTVSPSSSFPLSTTTSKRNELRGEIVKEKPATGLEEVTQSPVSGSSPSPPTVSETRLSESSPTAPAQPLPSKNDNETSTAIEKPDLNTISETTSLSTRKTDKENSAANSSSTTLETGNQDRLNISVTMKPLHPNNNSSGNTPTKRPSTAASATEASTKPGYTPAQVSNITNISVPISSSVNAKNETGTTTYLTATTISEGSTLQKHASISTMSVPSEQSSASTQSTPEMKPANTTNNATGQDTTVATNLAPWSVSTEGEPTNQTKSPTSSTTTSTPPNNITGTEASATPSSLSISNYHNTTSSTVTTKTTISTRNESTTAVTKPIPEATTSTPKLTSPKSGSTTTTTTTKSPPAVVPPVTETEKTTTKSPPAVVPPVTETEKTTTKSTTTTTTTTTIAPNLTTTPITTPTTQKSTNISKVTTEKPKENHTTTRSTNVENAGSATTAAFASLGTVIILVLVALVVVMIYMRRKDQEWFSKVIHDVTQSRSSSTRTCEELIPLKETTLSLPKIALVTKSIAKEDFSDHFDSVVQFNVASNSTVLADQFKKLALYSPPPPSADPDSYVTASKDINRAKNRYINILPYESTRVAIQNLHVPESDYINANFVKGANNDVEYIACQGPLAETSEDFWRMVFEHNVCVIAMVTNLEEKGKIKCHKYFPDLMEVMRYERIIIKCVQQAEFPVHTRRTFLVQENKGTVLKTVVHLHFREWPDFGCPKTPDLLISFCTTVRECATKCDEGLILVHCSAGVGRTGTLIALDILMQELTDKGLVNIFDTILQLRIQRINMVQTEGQYKYIHECVKEAILDLEKTDKEIFDPIYQNLKKKMEEDKEELKEVKSTSSDVVPKRESKCISKDILKSSLSEPLIENVDAVDESEEITEL